MKVLTTLQALLYSFYIPLLYNSQLCELAPGLKMFQYGITAGTDRGTRNIDAVHLSTFTSNFDKSKTSGFQAGNSLPYGKTLYLEFSF